LTPKQERFILEYLVDGNATQAAIRSGYSKATAHSIGEENLKKPEIAKVLAQQTKKVLDKVKLSAELVLENIRRPLAADCLDLYDSTGAPIPLDKLSPEARSLIAAIETPPYNADGSDGQTNGRLHRYKLVDRARYVEMAAKHFKLLTDVTEHKGQVEVFNRLDKGRARNAARP